jgi:xanthine dehydrogenase YagS FAD-binding subunit
MEPFTLTRPPDPQAAIAASIPGSKYLAGGTNLVDLMKMYVERPSKLVDIGSLDTPDLYRIGTLSDGGVSIGALVRNSDLAYDDRIRTRYPVLSQALLSGASPQLRNRATTGGNIMQRTRCPYFFDIHTACNKREPGSGCAAMNGYNRSHAILGTSDRCIAAHPSDMCVAMIALDARIRVQGTEGIRVIPFRDFHLLPEQTPEKETSLRPGELITAVDLPAIPHTARSFYLKIRDRSSYEFALTSAAVVLDMHNGSIRSGRIALGGVGTKPWRAEKAERLLKGKPSEQLYQAVATVALEEAIPHRFNAFKIELARRTLIRALTTTGGRS